MRNLKKGYSKGFGYVVTKTLKLANDLHELQFIPYDNKKVQSVFKKEGSPMNAETQQRVLRVRKHIYHE